MLLKAGENDPIPPSGKSSVVIGMSPKLMLVTLSPSTPESPTFVAKPRELREIPVPLRYMLFANANSFFSMNAKPATLLNVDSNPVTLAMLVPARPLEAAHGLMSNWPAPADPARSGFPAHATPITIRPIKNVVVCFFMRCCDQKLSRSVGRMTPNHLRTTCPTLGTSM